MTTVELLSHKLLVQLTPAIPLRGAGVKDPAITSEVRYATGWQ